MTASKGQFVVKLPRDRVDELVALGDGQRFAPRRGRLMKEWLVVGSQRAKWVELATEACGSVMRG